MICNKWLNLLSAFYTSCSSLRCVARSRTTLSNTARITPSLFGMKSLLHGGLLRDRCDCISANDHVDIIVLFLPVE